MNASQIVKALTFAQNKHKGQLQKGVQNAPFIDHLIEVVQWIHLQHFEHDEQLITATLLHDVLEKTNATERDIQNLFSKEILTIVLELTDNPSLNKNEQKKAQVKTAGLLSETASIIRIADKAQNIHFISTNPNLNWTTEQKFEYFEWAEEVVQNINGLTDLKSQFMDEHRWARLKL